MKLLINIIAIIVVAVVIGFQFNRSKNLYNKKYDENKDEFKKDLQTGVLSFVFDICKIARRNIHFITYLFAAFFAPRPRSFYSFSKCLEVIFFYRSFCHIYSPSYILLFPFLFGYVYTVPLNSHNNSYLYTCYCSCVRL